MATTLFTRFLSAHDFVGSTPEQQSRDELSIIAGAARAAQPPQPPQPCSRSASALRPTNGHENVKPSTFQARPYQTSSVPDQRRTKMS